MVQISRAVGSKNSGNILEFLSNKQFCHGRPSNQGEKKIEKKFLHFFNKFGLYADIMGLALCNCNVPKLYKISDKSHETRKTKNLKKAL